MNIDLTLKITTPITCKEGRKQIGGGTGFFFRHDKQLFLITNRHVLINENTNFFPDKIVIRLNTNSSDLTQSTNQEYMLYDKITDSPRWIELSKDIDLVALPIDDPKECIFAALGENNLPPKNLIMGLGEQVIVIGYPHGFYDEIHNLPIVRNASIASAYGVPFKNTPVFLIDSNLHPGTSGSPVITVPSNFSSSPDGGFEIHGDKKWYFLGVNSATFGELRLNQIWYADLVLKLVEKHNKI